VATGPPTRVSRTVVGVTSEFVPSRPARILPSLRSARTPLREYEFIRAFVFREEAARSAPKMDGLRTPTSTAVTPPRTPVAPPATRSASSPPARNSVPPRHRATRAGVNEEAPPPAEVEPLGAALPLRAQVRQDDRRPLLPQLGAVFAPVLRPATLSNRKRSRETAPHRSRFFLRGSIFLPVRKRSSPQSHRTVAGARSARAIRHVPQRSVFHVRLGRALARRELLGVKNRNW